MRRISVGVVLAVAAMLSLLVSTTSANEGTLSAQAKLSGFQEVPPKLTAGTGTFSATITGDKLTYKLLDWAITDAEARSLPPIMRASPHYYNTEAEIDRLIEQVSGLTAEK